MPNMNRERYATASKQGPGLWVWHPKPDQAVPFNDMDIDYLANCLRLVSRRRTELAESIPNWPERGDAIRLLLREDEEIINALIAELNSRETGEHEDD